MDRGRTRYRSNFQCSKSFLIPIPHGTDDHQSVASVALTRVHAKIAFSNRFLLEIPQIGLKLHRFFLVWPPCRVGQVKKENRTFEATVLTVLTVIFILGVMTIGIAIMIYKVKNT